jgi:hypothetical protein
MQANCQACRKEEFGARSCRLAGLSIGTHQTSSSTCMSACLCRLTCLPCPPASGAPSAATLLEPPVAALACRQDATSAPIAPCSAVAGECSCCWRHLPLPSLLTPAGDGALLALSSPAPCRAGAAAIAAAAWCDGPSCPCPRLPPASSASSGAICSRVGYVIEKSGPRFRRT